jgi:N-acetylneuraminate lyase
VAEESELPLLPYFRGAAYSPLSIMESLQNVDAIRGTKYTGPNMYEMTQIIDIGKDPWWVFSGMDEQCVFATMCGATGSIGSSFNVMSGVYKRIRELVLTDKQAEAFEYQKKANGVITTLASFGYAGALRAALGILGFECGDPRPPENTMTSRETRKLSSALKDTAFEELSAL